MAIRILIADDHALFRSGLRAMLEKESDLEVVGETGNGFDTIRAVQQQPVDVLLLDLAMPGLPGSRVAEAVLAERPRLAVVVLTMHEDEYYLRELFEIGARAFVLKKSTGRDLLQAIRSAYRGERYVDPALAGDVLASLLSHSPHRKSGRLELLTQREQEVCMYLAYGHTNAEIAERLCISERTVETHRTNLTAKLGLKSRAELVRFAIENGLLKPE
ncbi:MAG: response regulator transcription factor [Acidobacteriota bacterium]